MTSIITDNTFVWGDLPAEIKRQITDQVDIDSRIKGRIIRKLRVPPSFARDLVKCLTPKWCPSDNGPAFNVGSSPAPGMPSRCRYKLYWFNGTWYTANFNNDGCASSTDHVTWKSSDVC